MDNTPQKVKPKRRSIVVEKNKIDCSGLRLTPKTDEDGMSNSGKIIAVSLFAFLMGYRKGQEVMFRKHFTANDGSPGEVTFIQVGDILAKIN